MNYIYIMPDKRFKQGRIKRTGNVLRGHPETVRLKRLALQEKFNLPNPPVVVSEELAKEIKRLQ